jgi:hypothetical protein
MINLEPGQEDGELKAFQPYNLDDGPPPLNDLEVQLNEFLIADLTNPEQRAAAHEANQSRDRTVFNHVMKSKWA